MDEGREMEAIRVQISAISEKLSGVSGEQMFFRESMREASEERRESAQELRQAVTAMQNVSSAISAQTVKIEHLVATITEMKNTEEKQNERLASLTRSRDKAAGYVTIAGSLGAGVMWVIDHASKLFGKM